MDNLLLSPTTLAGRSLANRVVMAPMNRNRASGPRLVPPPMTATYYAQRAAAGLIIAEGTPVSPQARGCANTPGIYDPAQIAGWRKVTSAVHRHGGHIYLQLWHVGRVGHCSLRADTSPPVGASAIGLRHDRVPILKGGSEPVLALCDPPRALETTEVRAIVG
jgi:N-ethylmaleimide reductase